MIIDWEGASCGPAIADVALTWVIVGFSDVAGPAYPGRGRAGASRRPSRGRSSEPPGRSTSRGGQTAIRLRLADPNVLPREAVRLERLAAAALPPKTRR